MTPTITAWNCIGTARLMRGPYATGRQGELAMFTRRLDLNGLLNEIEAVKDAPKVGEGPQDL